MAFRTHLGWTGTEGVSMQHPSRSLPKTSHPVSTGFSVSFHPFSWSKLFLTIYSPEVAVTNSCSSKYGFYANAGAKARTGKSLYQPETTVPYPLGGPPIQSGGHFTLD